MTRVSQPTARKEHCCDLCSGTIGIGKRYIRYVETDDLTETKLHIHCNAIWEEFVRTHPVVPEDVDDPRQTVLEWIRAEICTGYDCHVADICIAERFSCPNVLCAITRAQHMEAVLESAGWGDGHE